MLAMAGMACGSDGGTPTPAASGTPSSSSAEYNTFIAATEFTVGSNRFPFALVSRDGTPLAGAQVNATFTQVDGDKSGKASGTAHYRELKGVTPHLHPDGAIHEHFDVRGIYVVDGVQFDNPGVWKAEFDVSVDGRNPKAGVLGFRVREGSEAPEVGERPPATRNATLKDVSDPAEIDTHIPPYPPMHEMSVQEALGAGKPFMVVWATPMFCTSQICGPVTDVAIEMHKKYGDRMNFLHIEPWDIKTARTEGRLVPTQEFREWKLPTEPWVFVMGGDGVITARIEGLATNVEMEAAIKKTLGEA
ncbi:MAG: hypothetical protein FJ320_03715 [SAR202 cluster bacterium]|nr:hypothetical protein [SAR202 cluster bacterium]